MANAYDVSRSWPNHFLEQPQDLRRAGGELSVWRPAGLDGPLSLRLSVLDDRAVPQDDGLIVFDAGVNAEAGAHIASEIRKISD